MNVAKCKYLDFVPGIQVDENNNDVIFIFTHKRNGKLRKKKIDYIGFIYKHPKTNHWAFGQAEGWVAITETMLIIVDFMMRLENKDFKFIPDKGELINVSCEK